MNRFKLELLGLAVAMSLAACQPAGPPASAPPPPAPEPAPTPAPAPSLAPAQPAPPVSDPLVSSVQTELIRLRLLPGPPDGVAGPRTRAAISKYQEMSGLRVDGKATQALLDNLRKN